MSNQASLFPMTHHQITGEFGLFGTVIAASTADTQRRRTAYFYRREAIEWARMARQWPGDSKTLCKRLALRYLSLYRQAKGTAEGQNF